MEKSSIISKNIKENYLKGMKAHSVSYPVIRYEDGKLYLAVYAFYYDKQDITVDKKIVRPKNYALLNIDTGIMEETYDCRRHDFTTGDFNKKYDISDTISKPSEKELEEAFAHLDKARELIKDSNPVFQKEYDEYMKVVMAQTPKEYQRFYRDLSVTENRKKSNKPVISMSMPEAVNGRGRRMQRDAIGNVDVDAKGKEAFVSVFGIENKRTQKTESNENSNSKEQNPVMEMNQSKMQEMLKGDEDKNTSRKEPDEFEKSEYTFRDIAWTPKQDLTQLPERYYQIAKRIAEHINFLPCDKPQIRFEFPIFCFRHDSNPGVDSWMMMQGMVLHRDLPKGHFRPKSNSNLYNIACRDKERCLFYTCPYVIAAYIKYLSLTNEKELERQRKEYESHKEEVDAEGNPGYSIFRTKIKKKFSVRDVKKARKFIDGGHFNISRKNGSADTFVVTYTSDPDHDQTPAETTKPITSFSIKQEQIEQGFMDGDLRMLSKKPIPKGVDVLIFTDYLIRTGKIVEMIPKTDPDDLIVLDF